ncbi:MAG: hypothetical protein K2Y22_16990 [Candidatus Obscuribacterales bacterium]|nr:hypothetical protein [Candidatus Obscuribacterales bacterium]
MSKDNLEKRTLSRHQYMVAIDGSFAIIVVLLVVQMWLLTASLEAYLSGHHDAAIPGAIFSGLLFTGVLSLYFFVRRLERHAKTKGL